MQSVEKLTENERRQYYKIDFGSIKQFKIKENYFENQKKLFYGTLNS